MGKLNGIISKLSGSAGNITFKRRMGETVVSEKVTHIRNPRSNAQMQTRTRWGNIIAMYKGIRPLLNYGFENKPRNLSDYNMFVKVNMQRTPIYLTKQSIAGGACIATAYQITQGSLPSIVTSGSGQNITTDISLGSDGISASTTVAQFARMVVTNNEQYQYGDQISFFLVKQKVNAETEIPYCVFSASKVILDSADTETKLWDIVNKNGFSAQDGCLGHSGNDGDCAFCWVHSRKMDGKTLVSTQSLVANNSKEAEYKGDLAYNLAKSSFGVSVESFLVPNGDVSNSTSGGGNDNPPSGGGGGGNDSL
jgi:hypothetical protein